jgi:6-phosphogluconolactonase
MTSEAGHTFVYVMASGSGELFTLEMDPETGALTAIDSTIVRAPAEEMGACPMTLSPDRRHLYVAWRGEPFAVLTFTIDAATGGLEKAGEASLPHSMAYVSTDRAGRYLFGASYPGHLLSISPIDSEGVAGEPQQIVATKPNAHAVRTDPSNRFLISSSLGGDVLQVHRFDAGTGAVSQHDPPEAAVKEGSGPRHFVLHPSGRYVYLLGELDASVYVFAFDGEAGTLTPIQSVSALPPGFTGGPAAADIHTTADGRFLYASVRNSSTLAGFRVDAETGLLSPVGIFPTVQQPRGFHIHPNGRYMLVAGQRSDTLATYAIDPETGTLTAVGEAPMGQGPNWVEMVVA